MAELESGFEDGLRKAVLDDVEQRTRNELGPALRDGIADLLDSYASRHDYQLGRVIDGVTFHVSRGSRSVSLEVWLPDPAHLFETGTDAHEVTGDPLAFIWERRHDPPDWVKEEYDREGDGWLVFLPEVEVAGIPEGRFVRDGLNQFRRRLER